MKQITSFRQVQELKVGSIIVNRHETTSGPFSVLSCTPIGWEDIEFELLPVDYTSWHGVTSRRSDTIVNRLGSEFVNETFWWISA